MSLAVPGAASSNAFLLLSDVVAPIISTVQTYFLYGKVSPWAGPRVMVLKMIARFIEKMISDKASSLSLLYNDIFPDYAQSNRDFKRGFVLFITSIIYASLFDDEKLRRDIWTSMTTVQISSMSISLSKWMSGTDISIISLDDNEDEEVIEPYNFDIYSWWTDKKNKTK